MSEAVRVVTGDDDVPRITLDRPPHHILTLDALDDLEAAFLDLDGPGVCVLRTTGDTFSAGVDVAAHRPESVPEMLEKVHGLCRLLAEHPRVVVCRVQGLCLGGGFELVCSTDIAVCSRVAELGQPEIDVGCFPPWAAALYPRVAGVQPALDLILTGRRIPAEEAARLGLVARAVPPARLDEAVDEVVTSLAGKSPAVLAIAKRALRRGLERATVDGALEDIERIYREDLLATEDAREGIEAFLDRREPRWTGR